MTQSDQPVQKSNLRLSKLLALERSLNFEEDNKREDKDKKTKQFFGNAYMHYVNSHVVIVLALNKSTICGIEPQSLASTDTSALPLDHTVLLDQL